MHGLFGFKCGIAATNLWNKRSSQAADDRPPLIADRKKYTANGFVRRGRPEAFLARQVPTNGRRKMVAKTDSRGWRPVVRFDHNPFMYDGRLLRATNHEPRATIFSRAEGHSRRCSQFELVGAKRHLSPRRPANRGLRPAGPSGPKFDERRTTYDERKNAAACELRTATGGAVRPLIYIPSHVLLHMHNV